MTISNSYGNRNDEKSVTRDRTLVIDRSRRVIYLTKKKLLPEDVIAFNFAKVLEKNEIRYVIVAGYTAILFGRARRSDDIDFIIKEIDESRFVELCKRLQEEGFTMMQGDITDEESVRGVYREYLTKGYSIRFIYRDTILPNIEVKIARTSIHRYALAHSIKTVINNEFVIRISPLELQIAYKLYMGSEKDIGDAVFLYTLFKNHIDHKEIEEWCKRLRVNCKALKEIDKL